MAKRRKRKYRLIELPLEEINSRRGNPFFRNLPTRLKHNGYDIGCKSDNKLVKLIKFRSLEYLVNMRKAVHTGALPPIKLGENNRLIDGRHRLICYYLENKHSIMCYQPIT